MAMRTNNPGTRLMLEKDNYRYEFFTRAIRKNNLSNEIAYYEPIIRFCRNFGTGSTYNDRRVSVEEGNQFYKKLLKDGYKKVSERSFA